VADKLKSDVAGAPKVSMDRYEAMLQLYEAQNAAGIARVANAEQYAPQTFAKAQELLADFPTERHPVLLMSLAWLAKLGIVDWLEPDLKVLHFY